MVEESGFQVGRGAPAFYESEVRHFMTPFVDALIAATVRRCDAVLDVACGTGFATRSAAAVAGPSARVEGVDVNPAMVAQARLVANDSEANIRWSEASGLDLPFSDGEFDAVICQQGLQFFPDPAAGVGEMRRIAEPGGRVGVTVWSAVERSPFFHQRATMLARHAGEVEANYSTTETQLHSWFNAGGFSEVDVQLVEVDVELPPLSTYVPRHLRALPWSAGFFALPDEKRDAALADLDAALSEYRHDDGIRVPFSSYLATATV
jgi:SAM-dependent methyltransferase